MNNVDLLIATIRLQRVDRDPRGQSHLLDALRRRLIAPASEQCCPPPCCFCCWEAL
ncbi:MAG TPA: hypothetical protein VKA00_01555 [Trueperaceae bacterium]|nr:hypothetical protein [Trueperaceae bacterium]